MDYISRYGLLFNPFLKNSKEVLVETEQYRGASIRLDYLLQTKGFGLLMGGAEWEDDHYPQLSIADELIAVQGRLQLSFDPSPE